jgi:hypothetical protein
MAIRPDNANTPLLLAAGAVVIWWGRIEGLIFQETMAMSHHPDVAVAKVCEPLQIATERLISQWAKASRIVMADAPDTQAEISRIKGELSDCAETRHVLVHGFWDYPDDRSDPLRSNVTVIKPERAGGVQYRKYEVDYPTLAEFHNRLSRLYHEVLSLTLHVGLRVRPGNPPTIELGEAKASPSPDLSLPPGPNRRQTLGLYRDRPTCRPGIRSAS